MSVPLPSSEDNIHVCTTYRGGVDARLYVRGALVSTKGVGANLSYRPNTYAAIGTGFNNAPNIIHPFGGSVVDVIAADAAFSNSEISQMADPFNVDLRIGGIPLILPPRRRYWPVVSETAIPKFVPWHLFQQVGV